MLVTKAYQQISAIEARGVHADDHLIGFGLGLGDIADFDSVFAQDCGFHGNILLRDRRAL
jgi:hypothetical protein